MQEREWVGPGTVASGHGHPDCDRRAADLAAGRGHGYGRASARGVRFLLALALMGSASLAQADVCSARFFHDGGSIEIAGTGILTVSAQLSFSKVRKYTADV